MGDAPTVFMPDHLRTILATKKDDSTGVYFQNCKEVLEGFFGNLEVVSAEGFKRFLEQMDTSYTSGCWRQTTEEGKKKDTKFVPTCTAGDTKAAVHPFRDVKSWFQ